MAAAVNLLRRYSIYSSATDAKGWRVKTSRTARVPTPGVPRRLRDALWASIRPAETFPRRPQGCSQTAQLHPKAPSRFRDTPRGRPETGRDVLKMQTSLTNLTALAFPCSKTTSSQDSFKRPSRQSPRKPYANLRAPRDNTRGPQESSKTAHE